MSGYDVKDVSAVRMEKAEQCLETAHNNIEDRDYKAAANRSYYAIFHSMRAILAFDSFDSKKHSGVISEFRRRYIKTGIFEADMSDIISNLFNIRGKSDYDDFFVISKAEV